MRLNLGCGLKPLPGYVNVDAQPLDGVDLVHDLTQPLPYHDGSADEIYAKHIVEHFSLTEWPRILLDWVRVLAPGGVLIVEGPDLNRVAANFLSNLHGARQIWHATIFGSDEPGMRHQQGLTIPWLREQFEAAGLAITRARSWHDDLHYDDQTYHYNLRIEGVKQ